MSKTPMQNLGMKVVVEFVPQFLLSGQKEHHAAISDLIQTATNEPDFLKELITLKGTEASMSYVQCFMILYLLQ